MNAVTSLLFVAVVGALAVWARPRQPHWVSRDGLRFIAMACTEDNGHGRPGRWTRVHGRMVGREVRIRQSFLSAGMISGSFTVAVREASEDSRFVIFTLGGARRVHLKVPASSNLVPFLESMPAGN